MNKLNQPGILATLALTAAIPFGACKNETDTVSGDTRDRVTNVVSKEDKISTDAAKAEQDGKFSDAAFLYRSAGNKAKAIECFTKVAAKAEQDGDYENAAWLYRSAGNEAKARECSHKK